MQNCVRNIQIQKFLLYVYCHSVRLLRIQSVPITTHRFCDAFNLYHSHIVINLLSPTHRCDASHMQCSRKWCHTDTTNTHAELRTDTMAGSILRCLASARRNRAAFVCVVKSMCLYDLCMWYVLCMLWMWYVRLYGWLQVLRANYCGLLAGLV